MFFSLKKKRQSLTMRLCKSSLVREQCAPLQFRSCDTTKTSDVVRLIEQIQDSEVLYSVCAS